MPLAQDISVYRLYAIVDEEFSPNPSVRLNHVADIEKTARELIEINNSEDYSERIAEICKKSKRKNK